MSRHWHFWHFVLRKGVATWHAEIFTVYSLDVLRSVVLAHQPAIYLVSASALLPGVSAVAAKKRADKNAVPPNKP